MNIISRQAHMYTSYLANEVQLPFIRDSDHVMKYKMCVVF